MFDQIWQNSQKYLDNAQKNGNINYSDMGCICRWCRGRRQGHQVADTYLVIVFIIFVST